MTFNSSFFHAQRCLLLESLKQQAASKEYCWKDLFSELKFVCNSRDYSFNLPTTLLTSPKRKIKVSSGGMQEMSLHKVHILYNLCHFKVSNSRIPPVCTRAFLSVGRAEVFHSDISLIYAWGQQPLSFQSK